MKNKKRLLVAVAAMSAFGIAAGTVSTFAWFGVGDATAKVATKTGYVEMTVSHVDVTVGEIAIPITVTVSSDRTNAELALAHYKDGGTKNLESGYIDQGGQFVPVANANLNTTFGGSVAYLYGTLTVNVKVDFGASGWTGSTAGERTFTSGYNTYTELYVLQQLQSASVDVTMTANSNRGKLFSASGNAASGDYFYAGESSSAYNTGWEIVDDASLAGIAYTEAAGESSFDNKGDIAEAKGINVGTVNYYIYGLAENTDAEDEDVPVTFTASVAKHS